MATEDELAETLDDEARHARPASASALPRGTTIDRYVVIDRLGRGGMGVVYAAYDHVLDRRIALKLVHAPNADGTPMLLGEARAMAQLSHPAIVPIHDVGEFRDQLFLAMAFVDGVTLRDWQTRSERSWRELVAMYVAIGEGLAFAHDEGIIHRDFKPDNVLVDRAGKPHITDFGLAKIVLAVEAAGEGEHAPHTLAGGTPGYMSPEQARAEPTDASTDQFAFCTSLFEALHGARPLAAPARRAGVPARITAALDRGLADDRTKRWPSMRELLAELAPPPRGRRARAIAGVAAIALAAAIGGLVLDRRHASGPDCDMPEARERWQRDRGAVIGALGAEVAGAFDRWTAQWTDAAQASCRATAHGAQTPQLLDLRTHCMAHALDVTGALLELVERGDPGVIRHAASIANQLPPLAPCNDAVGLLGLPPLPAGPVQRTAIAVLERELARAQALQLGESFREASALLDTLARPAIDTGYPPLAFELYETRSAIEIAKQTDPDAAAAAAWAAIAVEPARRDLDSAYVWIDLVWIVGVMQHAPAQAIDLARVAHAVVDQVHDAHQQALLDQRLAAVLDADGKVDDAVAHYERAAAQFAAQGDVRDQAVALGDEAITYGTHDNTAKQLQLLERAIALIEKLPHSQLLLADQLSEISVAYLDAKRYADARAALGRALVAIGDGSDDPALLAAIHGNLGNVAEAENDLATAEREYRAEVDIALGKLGPEVSDTELAWYNLGQLQRGRGELAEALASLHRSLAILQRAPASAGDSVDYAGPATLARQLVLVQLALHRPADALADAEACSTIADRDHVQTQTLADVHAQVATAAWAAGDRARAREAMRAAAAEYRAAHADSSDADRWLAEH